MFYEQAILTNKKDGLGVVWLAATLGAKHSTRKIQKRDYLSVNVPKTCDYIAAPAEPLALRTSSSLMVGVSRVFERQCGFFYCIHTIEFCDVDIVDMVADVHMVHTKIKQNLLAQETGKSFDLELPQGLRGKPDSLVLPDDPYFDLQLAMVPPPGLLDARGEFSDLSTTDLTNLSFLAEESTRDSSTSISRFAPGMLSMSGRPLVDELQPRGLLEQEDDDDPLAPAVTDALDFAFDSNGEMIDLAPTQTRSQSMAQRDAGYFDLESLEQPTAEEGFDRQPLDFDLLDTVSETRHIGLFEGIEHLSPIRGPLDQSTPQRNVATSELDFVDDMVLAPELSSKVSRKRRARIIEFDESTEINSAELKAWQSHYSENMKKQKLKQSRKVGSRVAASNAQFFTWRFQGQIEHPALTGLFCQGTLCLTPRETQTSVLDHNSDMVMEDHPMLDLERSRNPPGFNDDVEIGRRAGTEDQEAVSLRPSLLPWNISREGSQIPLQPGSVLSNTDAHDTPRTFSFIQVTPGERSASRGRSSLRAPSRLMGTTGLGGLERLDSQEAPVSDDQFVGFDVFGESPGGRQLLDDPNDIMQDIQQESRNFFLYARNMLKLNHDEQQASIEFGDIISRGDNTAFVAAQAFSHILLLASRGAIHLEQKIAYGPIVVSRFVDSD